MDDLWVERDQILEVLKHTEMALRKRILLDERAEFAGTLDDKGKRRLLKCKKNLIKCKAFQVLASGSSLSTTMAAEIILWYQAVWSKRYLKP
jgi:hypothetical protein